MFRLFQSSRSASRAFCSADGGKQWSTVSAILGAAKQGLSMWQKLHPGTQPGTKQHNPVETHCDIAPEVRLRDLLQPWPANSEFRVYYSKDGEKIDLINQESWHMFYKNTQPASARGEKVIVYVDLANTCEVMSLREESTIQASSDDPSGLSKMELAQELGKAVHGMTTKLSASLRSHWLSLIASEQFNMEDLKSIENGLGELGYEKFTSRGQLYEYLGTTQENWKKKVDQLVKRGLPVEAGEEFKLAAEDADGATISETFQLDQGGDKDKSNDTSPHHRPGYFHGRGDNDTSMYHRQVFYLKLKIIPRHDGLLDILLAVQIAKAALSSKLVTAKTTGPGANSMFKDYAHLTASKEWKREVQTQLIPVEKGVH